MDDQQITFESAVAAHQAGELTRSESAYRELLKTDAHNPQLLFLLGTNLLQLNKFEECIKFLKPLSEQSTASPDIHNNLGIALRAVGQLEEAIACFQRAIKSNPEYSQAYFNLGELLENGNAVNEAAQCYQKTLKLTPTDRQAGVAFARVLTRLRHWKDAENIYRQLLASDSKNEELQIQLAFVLASSERTDEALAIYHEMLKQNPEFAEVHSSVCYLYERQGKFDLARKHAQQAIDLNSDYAEAWNNLGSVALCEHKTEEAIDCFKKAKELAPQLSLAQFNIATTNLLTENYSAGWPDYELRLGLMSSALPSYATETWSGEAIPGRKLLIITDQGFGDTLQFIRFIKAAKEASQASEVTLLCQAEMAELLANQLESLCKTVHTLEDDETFDFQAPLCSLPLLLKINSAADISKSAYVQFPKGASPEIEKLTTKLNPKARKIGLVWRGNPEQARDIFRSCPLAELAPLWDLPNTQWVNLQIDEQSIADLEELKTDFTFFNAGPAVQDFNDTAWVMQNLDLVLTVDTSVAHLAGALGIPVWTMLCHTPDWRWHLERADSTWYPSMKLFRQPEWNDWGSLITNVRQELEQL